MQRSARLGSALRTLSVHGAIRRYQASNLGVPVNRQQSLQAFTMN